MTDPTPIDLAALTLAEARALVGESFVRPNPDGPDVTLRLAAAEPSRRDPRAATFADRPFSLLFLGPRDPRLTQGMHPLDHPAHPFADLFLVPVGERDGGLLYEAVLS